MKQQSSISVNGTDGLRTFFTRYSSALKNLMLGSERWSSLSTLLLCMTLIGCGTGVHLIQEGAMRGVVRYLYNEHEGPLLSTRRGEAFNKIKEFCLGPFDIEREGPTKPRRRMVEGIGGSEVITEHYWGIRFRCHAVGKGS